MKFFSAKSRYLRVSFSLCCDLSECLLGKVAQSETKWERTFGALGQPVYGQGLFYSHAGPPHGHAIPQHGYLAHVGLAPKESLQYKWGWEGGRSFLYPTTNISVFRVVFAN